MFIIPVWCWQFPIFNLRGRVKAIIVSREAPVRVLEPVLVKPLIASITTGPFYIYNIRLSIVHILITMIVLRSNS